MLFSFRMRRTKRALKADELHFQRLGRMVSLIHAEVENELEGLRCRYEGIASSAAFAQQAFENDQTREDLSARVRELTGSMMLCARRMASLDRQQAFITRLEDDIAAFLESDAKTARNGRQALVEPGRTVAPQVATKRAGRRPGSDDSAGCSQIIHSENLV